MRKIYLFDLGLLVLAGTIAVVLADEPVHPAKLSKTDIAGEVFERSDMVELTEHGNTTLDVVTLTSGDGEEQAINAGEAVTIPREWTGVRDTKSYTKIWVIYSEDGSGLE